MVAFFFETAIIIEKSDENRGQKDRGLFFTLIERMRYNGRKSTNDLKRLC